MKKLAILLPALALLTLSSCQTYDEIPGPEDPSLAQEFAYGTAVMIATPFEMAHDAASHVTETAVDIVQAPFK